MSTKDQLKNCRELIDPSALTQEQIDLLNLVMKILNHGDTGIYAGIITQMSGTINAPRVLDIQQGDQRIVLAFCKDMLI